MERHDGCLRHRSGARHSSNAIVTTDSSSNYFSLASKHFNTTSANELVLFSRFRANLSSPPFRLPSPPDPLLPPHSPSLFFSSPCSRYSLSLSPRFPSTRFFDVHESQPDRHGTTAAPLTPGTSGLALFQLCEQQ